MKAADHLCAATLCDYGLIVAEEANPPTKSQELLQNLVSELNMIAESSSNASNPSLMKQRLLSNDTADDMSSVGKYSVDGTENDGGYVENEAKKLDEHGRRRKLDAFINHTQLKLSLKKSIYEEPTLIEERALLIIEQAKEVTNLTLQTSLLTQAEKLLASSTQSVAQGNNSINNGGATVNGLKAKRELEDDGNSVNPSTKATEMTQPGVILHVESFATPKSDGRMLLSSVNKEEDDDQAKKKPATLTKAASVRGGGSMVSGKSKNGDTSSVASAGTNQGVVSADRDWSKIPPPEPRDKFRALLFSEIIELAWQHPHKETVPLVHKSIANLLNQGYNGLNTWNPIRYTSFVALQVKAQYILAETYACLVNSVDESELIPTEYDVGF